MSTYTPESNNETRSTRPGADFPGKTLGIIGLIVSVFASLVGLIISVIAWFQSRNAGYKNTPALAGMIVGAVTLVLAAIIFAASIGASVMGPSYG